MKKQALGAGKQFSPFHLTDHVVPDSTIIVWVPTYLTKENKETEYKESTYCVLGIVPTYFIFFKLTMTWKKLRKVK